MARKKKGRRKKKNKLKVWKRPARLASGKHWLEKYDGKPGSRMVRAYAKKYRTDLLCAILELRMLGAVVSEEYEEKVKKSIEARTLERKRLKKKKEEREAYDDFSDERFAYIAGYTSGGAAYGICLLYTSPSPRDLSTSRMPSSA